MTLDEAAEQLPEGWELRIEIYNFACTVLLFDDYGKQCDFGKRDTANAKVQAAVAWAKERELTGKEVA